MTQRGVHAQVDTRALRLEEKHDQSLLHAMTSATLMLIRASAIHAKRAVHASSHPVSVLQGLAGFASAHIQGRLISKYISFGKLLSKTTAKSSNFGHLVQHASHIIAFLDYNEDQNYSSSPTEEERGNTSESGLNPKCQVLVARVIACDTSLGATERWA